MTPLLTKSDFKACHECPTRLFYRKNRYPSLKEDNDYLQLLADGGFMIEYVARAQYPGAIDLTQSRNPSEAFALTKEILTNDATIFEAAAIHGKLYVRTDILRREGRIIHLIEVKSSSVTEDEADDSKSPFLTKKGEVVSRWREYLLDVAFQTYVLRLAFPEFEIRPYLCVIDKSSPVKEPETLRHFRLRKAPENLWSRPEVLYDGDPTTLANTRLLVTRPVSTEVVQLMPEVAEKASLLAALLSPEGVRRAEPNIVENYRICRKCEYRVQDKAPNGFQECWGELAGTPNHILDLHRVGQIGTTKFPDPVPALLESDRASYLDLAATQLGKEGAWQERRAMQWEYSRTGTEFIDPRLAAELRSYETDPGWPFHFIDFEACNIALPHHVGLRPYERAAFQWSCHTLDGPDAELRHSEWLNIEPELPNFKFVHSLRQAIGDRGTVYVWSPYERSTLNNVLQQLADWYLKDPEDAVKVSGLADLAALDDLAVWIEGLLGPEDEKGKRRLSPRIRDLHDLALKYYFHPRMKGRTSLKVVLPSVWESSQAIRNHAWFREYAAHDENGRPIDPYLTLPPLPLGDEQEEDAVREGTGAIRVYQDLIFADSSPEDRENRRRLLLQYCKLDTIAMVIVWLYWREARAA